MFHYQASPRTLAALIRDAWSLYVSTFCSIIVISLCISLLLYAMDPVRHDLLVQFSNTHHSPWVWALFVFSMIVLMFLGLLLSVVMMRRMHDLAANQAKSIKAAFSFSIQPGRLFRIFRCALSVLFMVGIGLALYVLPGVILIVFVCLTMPLVVAHDETVFLSIKHSFQYVWGHWWYTLGALFAPLAVSIIFVTLFDRLSIDPLTKECIDILFSTLMTPWVYATQLVLLRELSWRHEHAYES
jgi:hypothetical protein